MLLPTVRYMILCEDCQVDERNPLRVDVSGLIVRLLVGEQSFPVICGQICVFLALTSGRGAGMAQVICVEMESGDRLFGSPPRRVDLGDDPLAIAGLIFRLLDCRFPKPGVYSVEFWYNDVKVDERPFEVR